MNREKHEQEKDPKKNQGEKEINDFINNFSRFGPEVKRAFTEGCCYWFAYILKERFQPNARIICLPQEGHFITQIGKKYYDIEGNVTKKYQNSEKEDWEAYQYYEPSRAKRIAKECIYKI